MWHHTKLTIHCPRRATKKDSKEDIEIVKKDNWVAANCFKESAESDAPINDSIAYYSKFLKLGLGGVRADPEAATKWNKRARKAGSVLAMVQYAYVLEEDAKLIYDAIPRLWEAASILAAHSTNQERGDHRTTTLEWKL